MHALCFGENAAMANGAIGTEDAMQRMRREVQVGSTCARIPTRSKPDFRVDPTLELSPEGHGAPSSERITEAAAAAAATATARALL